MNDSMENAMAPWEDTRTASESYQADADMELYCDYLGKMRQVLWNVI